LTGATAPLFPDAFATARAPNPVFCHQEFLEKLQEHSKDALGRRAAFLMQRLAVDALRLHYKTCSGENRGWRRSRLGGNHGSHFYAWWAPKGAQPLQSSLDFPQSPDGAIFLRDIRHHDDHSVLSANSFKTDYLPVTVPELREQQYSPDPYTQAQTRFANARQPVRLLKGHPGSGKTTALWHAADSSGAERVLYVTYSRELAALARDYFDRFCSSHKQFSVVTFSHLVRQILGADAAAASEGELRRSFLADLTPLSRSLGAWNNNPSALYDELHAHLAGDALPLSIGRFVECERPRVPDKAYRERRTATLGQAPVAAALDIAAKLEKSSPSLADHYFPELALAWKALGKVRALAHGKAAPMLEYDCVAVDECQDLTPLETWLLVELVARMRGPRHFVPVLLAGDEAQTVRPTDFEWGWLNDLLHHKLGPPVEYELSVNLRSPQRIAALVNRVHGFYSYIRKQERPRGARIAEVEDDATDQILYCSATPGAELDELLTALSVREGLAVVTLEDQAPNYVPEIVRNAVLTVSEVKGLDFHSVCVLDGGRHVERVLRQDWRVRSGDDVEQLRKRLVIDQLRVALSRPTEKLFWLDVSPSDLIVRSSIDFLNGDQPESGVASCVPAAFLKTIQEDELELEERVQRCLSDARQLWTAKPDMAWSRAHQAVTLLGAPGSPGAVADLAARDAAYITLAEVCYRLGVRGVKLGAELGRPDPFGEASRAARHARRPGLANIISSTGMVCRSPQGQAILDAQVDWARALPAYRSELEPWVLLELGAKTELWARDLEANVVSAHNASILLRVLPPLYEALLLPDIQARKDRLQQQTIDLLLKDKQFATALEILRTLPKKQPRQEASCLEGMGDLRGAAKCHLDSGNAKEALRCYRSIPDFDQALKLVNATEGHPALESLKWIDSLRGLVAQRPDNFNRVVTPAEKKLLEELLGKALGVTVRKPATKKSPAKKFASPRKKTVRKPAG
jgi:AAA domain